MLRAQLPGRLCVILEVEACEPAEIAKQVPPPSHYGRLDYRLIHELSLQGLPRAQEDWHGIFKSAGCDIVEHCDATSGECPADVNPACTPTATASPTETDTPPPSETPTAVPPIDASTAPVTASTS